MLLALLVPNGGVEFGEGSNDTIGAPVGTKLRLSVNKTLRESAAAATTSG